MRRVRNLTYNNFIYIMGLVVAKGYPRTEAEEITRRLFAEHNPKGLDVTQTANGVLTKEEYEKENMR